MLEKICSKEIHTCEKNALRIASISIVSSEHTNSIIFVEISTTFAVDGGAVGVKTVEESKWLHHYSYSINDQSILFLNKVIISIFTPPKRKF